jgi:hypothetical protein
VEQVTADPIVVQELSGTKTESGVVYAGVTVTADTACAGRFSIYRARAFAQIWISSGFPSRRYFWPLQRAVLARAATLEAPRCRVRSLLPRSFVDE